MINILKVKMLMEKYYTGKVTADHIADILDVTKETVSKWSTGRTEPRLSQAMKLKELTKVTHLEEILN